MNDLLPNFTPIPNVVFDEWLPDLSDSAFKVLMLILFQTYGYTEDKASDYLSISQYQKKTGLTKETIQNALKELEEKQYISLASGIPVLRFET